MAFEGIRPAGLLKPSAFALKAGSRMGIFSIADPDCSPSVWEAQRNTVSVLQDRGVQASIYSYEKTHPESGNVVFNYADRTYLYPFLEQQNSAPV